MVGYQASRSYGRFGAISLPSQVALNLKCLLLFALLQAMDIATTGYGLALGITKEYNPLAASVLNSGLPVMLAAKALVVALVALFVIRLSTRFRRLWAALWIGNCFYLIVLTLNVWSLLP